jgi:hypothetical protein
LVSALAFAPGPGRGANPSRCCGELLQFPPIARDCDYIRAFSGEREGNGAAYSTRSAGHDSAASLQFEIHYFAPATTASDSDVNRLASQ